MQDRFLRVGAEGGGPRPRRCWRASRGTARCGRRPSASPARGWRAAPGAPGSVPAVALLLRVVAVVAVALAAAAGPAGFRRGSWARRVQGGPMGVDRSRVACARGCRPLVGGRRGLVPPECGLGRRAASGSPVWRSAGACAHGSSGPAGSPGCGCWPRCSPAAPWLARLRSFESLTASALSAAMSPCRRASFPPCGARLAGRHGGQMSL